MAKSSTAPKLTITTTIPDYEIPRERIRGVFHQIMSDHDIREGEVNIAIVDDEVIHATNREFLDHDYPTDASVSFTTTMEDSKAKSWSVPKRPTESPWIRLGAVPMN